MDLSLLMPILIILSGLFLLVKLKFFFILHPIKTMKKIVIGLKDRNVSRSFFLALSGTLGVGNIFGVAAGIMIGGEGSLFWLFLSSIFSAIIKYAEVLLVFDRDVGGGMAGLICATLKRGRILSVVYAGFTVILSLTMGAAIQASAVCDVGVHSMGFHPLTTVFIIGILLIPALIGGAKRIENITEYIIPLTTIIYIIMCFSVIFVNFDRLPTTVFRVVKSAFSFRSATGGITALAIKEGFARGVLSNEAGTGTSALAHSRSKGRSPHLAGLFGMCEVFFDTTVLCSLTGLSILLAVDDISSYETPMSLVFSAFQQSLGGWSNLLLPLIFAFAYSTMICWFYYGMEYCRLYFSWFKGGFIFAFLGFLCLSYILSAKSLLYFTDLVIFLMTLLTLSVICKGFKRIKKEGLL